MSDSPSSPAPRKPRQGRSPAFPFIALNKAIERAETFRIAEGGRPKHFAPVAAVCKAWGLGPQTGPAIQTVAALGHFGLFEFEGSGDTRSARLTELAFNILLDKQPVSAEREEFIRQAALKPRIHKELWDKWAAALGSDYTLQTYLVRDRGFSENGARDLIAEYKATLAFAKLDQSGYIPPGSTSNFEEEDEGETPSGEAGGRNFKPPPPPVPPVAPKGQVLVMDGERVAFTEESQPGHYLKLIASGNVDDTMLEALEDYVKRQRKRLNVASAEIAEILSRKIGSAPVPPNADDDK